VDASIGIFNVDLFVKLLFEKLRILLLSFLTRVRDKSRTFADKRNIVLLDFAIAQAQGTC